MSPLALDIIAAVQRAIKESSIDTSGEPDKLSGPGAANHSTGPAIKLVRARSASKRYSIAPRLPSHQR